jgi:hypothetical protein
MDLCRLTMWTLFLITSYTLYKIYGEHITYWGKVHIKPMSVMRLLERFDRVWKSVLTMNREANTKNTMKVFSLDTQGSSFQLDGALGI